MAAALYLGLLVGDLYDRPSDATLRWATAHRLTGTAAALAVVFVESVVVTYFIGTSRWCKEVVDTYRLDPGPAEASRALKRRTFPWALVGMLVVVVVGALGAAGDPATGRPNTQPWGTVHLIAACAGMVVVTWTYIVAWKNVLANHAVIDQIVDEVARVREARGLDAPSHASRESEAPHASNAIE